MFPKAFMALLAIAAAACDQPLPLSPSSPSQLPTPAVPQINTVRVGESLRVTLGAADYIPFDQFGDEKWERVIQVTSSETVTAESRVVVENNAGLGEVYVGTPNSNIGKNCRYGTRSITCTIPSNAGIDIVVTVYPAGPAGAANPTFTLITQRVES
jgi:hypothetical protein